MDITRRTDYAIRIMTALTAARGDVPVSLRELAGVQDVPYAFARNVQRDLMTAGLVTTARGANGGLTLARPAEQITVLDIVEATHGDTSISVCTRDPGWCERAGSCSVHRIWKEADALVRQHLGSKTLAGLVTESGK